MKQFACGSVVPGCKAVFEAESDDAILEQVARHATRDHGIAAVPDELVTEVRRNIVTLAA